MPQVFLSYSHDSPEHTRRVRALADQLRKDGIDARIDQYTPDPDEGWHKWMRTQVKEADKVLLVFTETYQRRFEGDEEEGRGLGATFEGVIVTQTLYEAGGRNAKFRPLVFGAEYARFIPVELRRFTHYRVDTPENYQTLLRWLLERPRVLASELGTPPALEVEPTTKLFQEKEPRRTIHNLPFLPNPLFTGRESELEWLGKQLRAQGDAITQSLVIHGLGGVGKTELAVEYAWKHLREYNAVLWVRADSSPALDIGLAALAPVLGLPEADEREQLNQTKAVLTWLHDHERWLLIADNADTDGAARAVRDRLPPELPGHVLVTSRLNRWPVNIPQLPLELFTPDEAARYLLARVHERQHEAGDEAAARKLAEELGNLPLALEQAASFLVEVRWDFGRYRERFREARPELLSYEAEGATRYSASVAKTWSISLDQLTPLARGLLRIAAWWPATDAMPRGVFAAGRNVLSEALGGHVELSDIAIARALGELDRFSLVRLASETVSVHRLLQAVEQDSLTNEERKRWLGWAIRIFTTEAERKHLLNLARGRTSNYQGHHSLRSELRRLRWMGLLAMTPGHIIADIRDGLTQDLSLFVGLTPYGKDWVEVIRAMLAKGGLPEVTTRRGK
jgi:hypothetical protein